MKILLLFCFIFFSLLFGFQSADAAINIWTGGGLFAANAKWSNPNNWSTGSTPTSADDVTIPFILIGFGYQNPIVDVTSSCKSVTITTSATITLSALLTVTGSFTCNAGLSISIPAGSNNTLSVGSMIINSGTGFTINANNTVNCGSLMLVDGGSGGASLKTTGCTFNLTGNISSTNAGNGNSITNSGSFNLTGNITSGGAFSITNNSGGAFNISACNYTSGTGDVITNTAGGTFTVNGGSSWDFSNGGTIKNSGIFNAGTAGSTCIIYLANFGAKLMNNTGGTFNLASTSEISFENPSTTAINTASNTVTNSGTFIIMSDANGSGTIGQTNGNVNVLQGTYQVQRYVQGNNDINYRGYRLMTSPVNTAGKMDLSYLPLSTIVTGAVCSTCTTAGNPTIYLYKEPLPVSNTSFVSGNFVGVSAISGTTISTLSGTTTNTGLSVTPGNGFFIYFRGDKTTNLSTKTAAPFASPENVTFTATGTLNQGNITVNDWFTTGLSYTSTQVAAAQGFNLVGNPYPASIDWDTFTSPTPAILGTSISTTIYLLRPDTKTYVTYVSGTGGVATNFQTPLVHSANIIPSGEAFFVKATGANPTLQFTEGAKIYKQQVAGVNLTLAATTLTLSPPQYLRIQLFKDAVNNEDAILFFRSTASSSFVLNEDGTYLKGGNAVSMSTLSADKVALAVNLLPLPKTSQSVPLNISATSDGAYQLNLTEIQNIPNLFDVWLMDAYKKDSLDIKHNPTYSFAIANGDTNSTGSHRFTLVIRQNAAYSYHLLNFTGNKVSGGDELNWTTQNEENYTGFVLERNTNNGNGFVALGSVPANGSGSYSYLDTSPAGMNLYRLKQTDFNGTVTYSNVVQIGYAGLANSILAGNNISVYPNPVKDVLNLNILISNNVNANATYSIDITNSSGSKIKTYTSQQTTWQNNTSDLLPGVYIVKVINNADKSIIGTTKFIKL